MESPAGIRGAGGLRLVHPDTRFLSDANPYDLALSHLRAPERRQWSRRVLTDLIAATPTLQGKVVEIHAGKYYAENGLTKGLRDLGAIVCRPLAHIGIFNQPAWYRQRAVLD